MAGEFTTYNVERIGTFFRRQTIVRNLDNANVRGSVAIPLPLNWGDKIVKLTGKDVTTNSMYEKIGINQKSESILPIILMLQNCKDVYVYRSDNGGTKATTTIGASLVVTAKYTGLFGNNITVSVESLAEIDSFRVVTYVDGRVKDRQVVKKAEDLIANDYVVFEGTGAITAVAGTSLSGGTNGTIITNYTEFLDGIKYLDLDVIAVLDNTQINSVVKFIEDIRKDFGKDFRAVVNNANVNNEYVIKLKDQGFKTSDGDVISGNLFTAYISGLEAGSDGTVDNSYYAIPEATELINPVDDVIDDINNGYYILTTRADGAVIVEEDVNSLMRESGDKLTKTMQSNRNTRIIIGLKNRFRDDFDKNVIGKIDGLDTGLDAIQTKTINILKEAETNNEIKNFNPETDVEVVFGDDDDTIIINAYVQTVKSIKKVYINLYQRV